MSQGHFATFETAFPAAPLGQDLQVRVGCCSVLAVNSADPDGGLYSIPEGGDPWSNPSNARRDDASYATVPIYTSPRDAVENVPIVSFSQWLYFQDFKFALPAGKTIQNIRMAFKGYVLPVGLCDYFREQYNWGAIRGGTLYPVVQDIQPMEGHRAFPVAPNPPYSAVKGWTAALGDLGGDVTDCITEDIFAQDVTDWFSVNPGPPNNQGLFATQDYWSTNDIDPLFGLAVQACAQYSVPIGTPRTQVGTVYMNCCAVGIYHDE